MLCLSTYFSFNDLFINFILSCLIHTPVHSPTFCQFYIYRLSFPIRLPRLNGYHLTCKKIIFITRKNILLSIDPFSELDT